MVSGQVRKNRQRGTETYRFEPRNLPIDTNRFICLSRTWWNTLAPTEFRMVPDRLTKHKSRRCEIGELFRRHLVSACPCCCFMLHPWYWFNENTSNIGWLLEVYLEIQLENQKKHLWTTINLPKQIMKTHRFFVVPTWRCQLCGLSVSDSAELRHSIDGRHTRQRIKVLEDQGTYDVGKKTAINQPNLDWYTFFKYHPFYGVCLNR